MKVNLESPQQTPPPQKHAGGRPTDYRPEFCERVVELAGEGMGVAEIAAELGVTRQSLHLWRKEKPEFFNAMTRAYDAALAWWERQGRIGIWEHPDGGRINANLYRLQMLNRFRADWSDRVENVMQNPDGTAIAPLQIVVKGAELPKAKGDA